MPRRTDKYKEDPQQTQQSDPPPRPVMLLRIMPMIPLHVQELGLYFWR
jgi:hypothetical protein